MDGHLENVVLARQYLKALESGPSADELAQFFASEVVVEIFPSKFFPNGSRDGLAGIFAAAERGKKVMTSQKYEIRNEAAGGDKVALEIDWTGTLAVPFQTIPKGGQMRAHFAAFLEFKDGKIVSQRNYDCYEP
jgi:ketosteroid isomerase-like protein